MIPTVKLRSEFVGIYRVADDRVRVDHPVKGPASPDPFVDGLPDNIAFFGIVSGALKRGQSSTKLRSMTWRRGPNRGV